MIKGIGASRGIAMGTVLVLAKQEPRITEGCIEDTEQEVSRFNGAIEKSRLQLKRIKDKAKEHMGDDNAAIFEAHLMVLEDPELISSVEMGIKSQRKNAEYILDNTINTYVSIFESMDNEYMKERAADVKDVGKRILYNLLGIEMVSLDKLDSEVIIAAHDLAPSDTAQMDKEKVLGFVTDIGGRTSHTAIMARSLEIPAVVGLRDITSKVQNDDFVIIDGDNGEVIINPSEDLKTIYKDRKDKWEAYAKSLQCLKDRATSTKDGRHVELGANIGTPKDLKGVLSNGAEGIGLYRTEFLYMDRKTLPTEEEQYAAYREVLEAMEGKPVVIRTLDIGGDKEVPCLDLPKELNPFLGYRAIRICLDRTDIFKTQLRALLRSSVHGTLKIMYPMISCLDEVRAANGILSQAKEELEREGIAYSRDIEVGIMIEIPSAAIISDILAKEVDFFSIGTNDLIQYSVAVDRMNQNIAHLYTPYHPALLRLIKMIIDNGHREGIWVGMCGEAAGELPLIPVLLGLGLDEFSMSPSSILGARKLISELTLAQAQTLAQTAFTLPTALEVLGVLGTVNNHRV